MLQLDYMCVLMICRNGSSPKPSTTGGNEAMMISDEVSIATQNSQIQNFITFNEIFSLEQQQQFE